MSAVCNNNKKPECLQKVKDNKITTQFPQKREVLMKYFKDSFGKLSKNVGQHTYS